MPLTLMRLACQPPPVAETPGALELPLTGFVTLVRVDTVRLVGYVSRGEPEARTYDNTVILHMPKTGFRKSLVGAIAQWHRMNGGLH